MTLAANLNRKSVAEKNMLVKNQDNFRKTAAWYCNSVYYERSAWVYKGVKLIKSMTINMTINSIQPYVRKCPYFITLWK